MLGLACVGNIAVRQSHLPHFRFRHLQTRVVSEWIGWEEREPVLVSLRRLDQRARCSFEIERIGDGEFRQRQKRRIGIGVDDGRKKETTSIVAVLANFLRSFFEKHAIASGNWSACQLGVFIVATAEQSEELPFFLLLFFVRRGRCGAAAGGGSLLESSFNACIQLGHGRFQAVECGSVELFGLVVL